jgi:hypothetical protein
MTGRWRKALWNLGILAAQGLFLVGVLRLIPPPKPMTVVWPVVGFSWAVAIVFMFLERRPVRSVSEERVREYVAAQAILSLTVGRRMLDPVDLLVLRSLYMAPGPLRIEQLVEMTKEPRDRIVSAVDRLEQEHLVARPVAIEKVLR